MNVQGRIYEIVSRIMHVPADQLAPDVEFRSLPDADSQRLLQVILETENAFDIEIDDDATFRIETIGEYVDLVEELRQQPIAA